MILAWDDDVFHQSDDVSAQIKVYPQNRWAGPYSFAIDFNERDVDDSETWVIQNEVEWLVSHRMITVRKEDDSYITSAIVNNIPSL